jgi:hypothetical protein
MKNHIRSSCLAVLILADGLFATTFQASGAAYSLTINENDPSAVVITGSVTPAAALMEPRLPILAWIW